jgi:hypothetical protein
VRPRRRLRLACRRITLIAAIPFLAAGTLAAASAPARTAAGHQAGSRQPAPAAPTGKRPLSAAQALSQARATHHPVTVSSLTSPTSMTTARPDGSYQLTESALPVRAWRHGAWASLNPALHRDSSGTISPAVTTSGLAFSGGGSAPFAVMTTDARTLSLSWPGTLPTPAISGATATYANVLPGVDLTVTANAQGGFSSVLVVKNAAAAANPALASLKINTTAPGLDVLADAGGNLRVAPSATAPPVFTAPAPLVWDSAPPPAGMPTATGPDGTLVNAQSGLPADSSPAAPGAGAHTAAVGVAASGGTITLSPPASALTGPGVVYPVYIDPTWWPAGGGASAWTQVDSGYPNTAYWKESSDLQAGLCDFAGCNGIGTVRSFVRLPIPSQLTTSSVIHSANLYTTDVWAPSCTATSVRLYTVGVISNSTTWNNQPNWATSYSYQDAAFGYSSSCKAYPHDVTWDVTSTITGDIGARTTQTWGLRAASETNDLEWKQFLSGSSNVTLSVMFNDPPYSPGSRATSPGGTCQHSASTAPVIGNDDVIFSGYVTDPDGDNNLTTRFIILNADGSTAYDSSTKGTSVKTAHNQTAALPLTRSVMQSLHSNGATTAYTYHWYAITTDDNGLTNPNPKYDCYFTYNPLGPSAPSVSVPSTAALGQSVTATFSTTGCGSASPCPATYVYQLGAAPPITINIATDPSCTTTSTSATCSPSIKVPRVGPMLLSVSGIASSGNVSQANAPITGTAPANPYADGDFNNDANPDILTVGASSAPGLWLSPGTGSGTLGGAVDIGGAGNSLNSGSDGPGDWSGALILHGDFTGNHVQDVMAYYPATGYAIAVGGTGDISTLLPSNATAVPAGTFADPVTYAYPTSLVAAGNASLQNTGVPDLIGIASNGGGYELDLFSSTPGGGVTGYGLSSQVLSAQTPDGAYNDWNNYDIATAQPGGDTVLFALSKTTGALYESTNPTQSTSTLIGTGNWQQITATPWGTSPPALISGDVNSAGQTELWTRNGAAITAYTISGTTLSEEHASTFTQALHDWPMAEGNGTTTVDTITAQTATLTGGATWAGDNNDPFAYDVALDGTSGYVSPPASTIPTGSAPPSISIWFKTSAAGGVLVSMQKNALSSGGALPSQYDPVLYIGNDGKLYGEWWNGTASPAISTTIVDDGIWHHAVLAATTTSQTLYLDGQAQQTLTGATTFQFTPTNLAFGAGYIGGPWPSETNYQKTGLTDYRQYFNGEIADATYG